MLESFLSEKNDGIFMGNLFIPNDLEYLCCATAVFHNFKSVVVAKDYMEKKYTAVMLGENEKLLGKAYAKFRSNESNKFFENWLKEHKIKLVELGK